MTSINFEIKSYNQEKIIDIAKNNLDWQVRRVAVEHIKDESVLMNIVNFELTSAVAIKAMERIVDKKFLSDICLNHPDAYVRLACINRISDESLLLKKDLSALLEKMLFNDPNEFVFKSVCENPNLESQETLIKAIFNIDNEDIQRLLLRKIADEDILMEFAINNENPFIRREAIQNPNLTNLEILSEIIKNDCDDFNRIMAIYKIPDEESLLEIIFDKSIHHRLPEISQNTTFLSYDYFLNILKNETDEYKRQVAVSFLEGDILESIVLNESGAVIRADAIKNISFNNQNILDDLISNEKNPKILFEVVSKIENQKLLNNFIMTHLEPNYVIFKAISRVDDINLLKELSTHPDLKIRFEAVKRISEFSNVDLILRDIALTENDEKICLLAINAMKIRNDLIEVAESRQEKNIRMSALNQIEEKRLIETFLKSASMHSPNDDPFELALNELALNDKDEDVRIMATSKILNKRFLDKIAFEDDVNSFEAQKRLNSLFEDIKRIENEKILKKLIKNSDKDVSSIAQATLDDLDLWEDRLSKINEIDDINALNDIALNDFNNFVRLEAEGKLEKILFHIRLNEINFKDNQIKLKDIVCNDEFSMEIRQKALLQISDDIFVKKVNILFKG